MGARELRSKGRKKLCFNNSFTSFFPKSPPGFMVAKIRNFFPAVNSSTSLSLSSRLPFQLITESFPLQGHWKKKFENVRLEKASVFSFVVTELLKRKIKSSLLRFHFS